MAINWPTAWSPAIRKAKVVLEAGVIGRVLEVKWRAGHAGPLGQGVSHPGVDQAAAPMTESALAATWWHQRAAGGGATLDYCCYGANLTRWYVGEQAVAAVGMWANLNSHWGDADDNGVLVVRFPSALGLIEGSWTTLNHGVATGPIIYGTDGTLVIERQGASPVVRIERGGGETTIVPADDLPAGRRNIAEELIHHLETGKPLHETLQQGFNLEVMAILDAGVRSAASGKIEMVNNVTWET
jgi:predicted dehydrogenase